MKLLLSVIARQTALWLRIALLGKSKVLLSHMARWATLISVSVALSQTAVLDYRQGAGALHGMYIYSRVVVLGDSSTWV